MTDAHEAVKTRHKETSLAFPVLALAVLFFWGSSQSLPVVVAINILALVGILSSAFSVVRHADVLAHRLGEPYGSLILSLSVVILEVSLISALMATGDAAPTLMRDTLYSIIMIVTGGLVGFSLLLGGRKFATQYMNLFGIKQYLIALFPLAIIVLVFPMALPGANFTTGQALLVALIFIMKAFGACFRVRPASGRKVDAQPMISEEEIAAIATALKIYKGALHDRESEVLTILNIKRAYSPWNSKIHGLTQLPDRR